MAETRIKATPIDPSAFIASVEPPAKREDARVLDALFQRATGVTPSMWGPSIVGYGSYHYRYASGHEGDAPRVGFSPRKAKHSLDVLNYTDEASNEKFAPLLATLGKHTRGAGCLYVNKLADIDLAVLEEIVALSWSRSCEDWPES